VRRLLWAVPVSIAIAVAAGAAARGPTAQRGVVARIVDGNTLVVRLAGGKQARVRIAGIAAPTGRDCYSAKVTARTRALALGKRVQLSAAGGRWYVTLPSGVDLGRSLVADGFAQVDVWGPAFSRFADYVPSAQLAETKANGLWRSCAADVSATVTPVSGLVATGADAAFALELANHGPLAAPGVTVDLRPPSGSSFVSVAVPGATCAIEGWHAQCSLTSLAPGAAAKGTVVVKTSQPGVLSLRAAEKFGWCTRARCGSTPVADPNRQNDIGGGFLAVGDAGTPLPVLCAPSYPTVCIPPPPPRLECNDIPFKNFQVRRDIPNPDPQRLDNNQDGVGCTFDDY
jgi:endonuclease YncB( thermonuclease family)